MYAHVHVFNERCEGRKKEASKVKQARSNKQGKAHSTPKAVTFPGKNELPRVGLEPTTLYTLDRALYQLSYQGCSAGWVQISHLIVHLMNRLTINSEEAGVIKPPKTPNPKSQTEFLMRDEKEERKKQARSNK